MAKRKKGTVEYVPSKGAMAPAQADDLATRRGRRLRHTRTTPSSTQATPPQDVVAGPGDHDGVNSAASSTLTTRRNERMSEQEELGSIVEYAEDLEDQEQPEPLPVREYEAEIRQAIQKTGNQSGKKYAAVTFHIPVEQYPPDYPVEQNPDGVSIIYRMVSTEDSPKARWSAKRFVKAIGAKPGKRLDLNDWVGLTAVVGIQHDDYEGVTREVITKVSAI